MLDDQTKQFLTYGCDKTGFTTRQDAPPFKILKIINKLNEIFFLRENYSISFKHELLDQNSDYEELKNIEKILERTVRCAVKNYLIEILEYSGRLSLDECDLIFERDHYYLYRCLQALDWPVNKYIQTFGSSFNIQEFMTRDGPKICIDIDFDTKDNTPPTQVHICSETNVPFELKNDYSECVMSLVKLRGIVMEVKATKALIGIRKDGKMYEFIVKRDGVIIYGQKPIQILAVFLHVSDSVVFDAQLNPGHSDGGKRIWNVTRIHYVSHSAYCFTSALPISIHTD
jgi:hypothetical protein